MKKIISVILALTCVLTCVFALAGCGGSIPDYYGKTITFTGNALPILWDKKCQYDNGPDNSWDESKHDLTDKTYYSFRELLTKYWDRIDWDHDSFESGKVWASMKGKTVDEFIAEVDKGLVGFYDNYMNLSRALKFEFGNSTDRTLKITVTYEDGTETIYNTKFIETDAQLNEEKGKIDPKADYMTFVQVVNNTGRDCIALLDTDNNGLYDSYFEIHLTNYVVNGDKWTCGITSYMKGGETDEYTGNYLSKAFSFDQVSGELALWGYTTENGGASSVVILPLYPEVVVE